MYRCRCCGSKPKPNIFYSSPTTIPSTRNFSGDRIHLIESAEGNLIGICSNTGEIAHFKHYKK
jgi:hypothetical protein